MVVVVIGLMVVTLVFFYYSSTVLVPQEGLNKHTALRENSGHHFYFVKCPSDSINFYH